MFSHALYTCNIYRNNLNPSFCIQTNLYDIMRKINRTTSLGVDLKWFARNETMEYEGIFFVNKLISNAHWRWGAEVRKCHLSDSFWCDDRRLWRECRFKRFFFPRNRCCLRRYPLAIYKTMPSSFTHIFERERKNNFNS